MKEYAVKITETLEKFVTVEAENWLDAQRIAEENWRKQEYILDADNYIGTTFEVLENLDRYFYIIERNSKGEKVIHMQGNIYSNDDGSYKHAEWTFLYLGIKEAKYLFYTGEFFKHVDERADYIEDITKEIAIERMENYFDESSGENFYITDVTEDTPCGCYWFENSR